MGKEMNYGYIPRNFEEVPVVEGIEKSVLQPIRRADWRELIELKKKNKANISDIMTRKKIPLIIQNPYGYCHSAGCVNSMMTTRALANKETVHLSLSSIAGPITGYRDVGMPIYAALKRAISFGAAPVDLYPEATTKNFWTKEVEVAAAKYKVEEWTELETYKGSQSKAQAEHVFDLVATSLLLGFPVVVGLMWWGHCVMYANLDFVNGVYVIDGINSWGPQYRDNGILPGWFRFAEGKATPYEAYSIRTI